MRNERILVTGATGFIGSALVTELGRHNELHALVRDVEAARSSLDLPPGQIHGESRVPGSLVELFEDVSPSFVFHLATHYEQRDDPDKVVTMVDANVRFGALVLDAASCVPDCTVVIAGSHFQFVGEEGRSASFYAATKNALCEIASYLQDARGLRWVQSVIYDAYGPGDRRPKLINVLIDRVREGATVMLPFPEPLHHFVYIDDVLSGLVSSATETQSGAIASGSSVFLSSDESVIPSDVLAEVGACLGTDPVLDPKPYPLPSDSIMTPFEGPAPPGWKPLIDLHEGIARTVRSR